jgi:tetratricopeptide (TPR) repeat protein
MWPVYAYLRGEALRRLGRPEAVDTFRQLARWGASQPQGDRWGGSSLAFFGLWYWVRALETADPPQGGEVEEVLRLESVLRNENRLVRNLLTASVLDSLPRLEEDCVRRLTAVALRAGRKGTAQRLLVEYLTLSQSDELDAAQRKMLEEMVRDGVASPEAVLALRAERMESLQKHEYAQKIWQDLEASAGQSGRARARLHLAKIQYLQRGASRSQIAGRLDAVLEEAEDPDVVQDALLTRATNWSREGAGQDYRRYFDDLRQIVERFPQGLFADDALYRSALMHWRLFELTGSEQELAAALEHFRRVREFPGQNDWFASAHFSPAIALIQRGRDADLREAIALLETLNRLQPTGELHRHAAFWRARALEALGSTDSAVAAFREVWSEHRYDYYGLRARMHWRLGSVASSRLWPDAETRNELHDDFGGARPDSEVIDGSAYHARLRTARAGRTRAAERGQIGSFGEISDVSLDLLDQSGLLPGLALFLSSRQDVSAAAEAKPDASNFLAILAAAGSRAADWPMATALAVGAVPVHLDSGSIGADPRFLRSAYVPVFRDVLSTASRESGVPAELLYALARRESLFDPKPCPRIRRSVSSSSFQRPSTTSTRSGSGASWRRAGSAPGMSTSSVRS